jgi:tripartite-type tricarboxylate transporter receptor subunit TctC
MFRLAGLAACAAAALIVAHPHKAQAQDAYPTQTVRFVVPAPAGSTTDLLARTLADQLAKRWGRGTMVENISGGAMNIGARAVARATPDGHTLLVAPPLPLSYSHLLYRDVGYEPGQFVPITLLATIPNVLVVRRGLPVETMADFIAYAKANPGKVTYASGGLGTTAHLSAEQLAARAGLKMVHVPYRGSQPALTDVVNGHVDIFFDTLTTSVPLYRDKQVKIIAAADLTRAQAIPEVPTLHESGLPDYRSITWFGLVAPPGTPAALADRINRDAVEVLKSTEMQTFLNRVSLSPGALSPADTRKFFTAEAELWTRVIKEAGIELQTAQ